jgi:hypothetical protein
LGIVLREHLTTFHSFDRLHMLWPQYLARSLHKTKLIKLLMGNTMMHADEFYEKKGFHIAASNVY